MNKLLATCAASLALLAGAAQALPIRFEAVLSGTNEVPPNASTATGHALITIDGSMMHVEATFAGLSAPNTAAHIHCCFSTSPGTFVVATPTPTFPGFPAGATSGAYDAFFDLDLASSYRAGFITSAGGTVAGAKAAFVAGLGTGTAYFNIHTTAFPGGEIRGNLIPIPEPATALLALVGLGVAGAAARRRPQPQAQAA